MKESLPLIVYGFQVLSENLESLERSVFPIFRALEVKDPVRWFRSVMIQPIIGIEYQDHYRKLYPKINAISYLSYHIDMPTKILIG